MATHTKKTLNIGLMTGGGDCPGLNSAITGIVKTLGSKHNVIGFLESWKGLTQNMSMPLTLDVVDDLHRMGGTLLKSSKSFPLREHGAFKKIEATAKAHKLDACIVIGGDSTLFVASQIQKKINLPMLGIPKTIDNDIPHNDFSIGFMTAVETVCTSIEQVKTSAKSHNRAIVVEIMGRHTGSLCAYAGLASGCDIILVPEHPIKLKDLKKDIQKRFKGNKRHLIIAAAEGAILLDDQDQAITLHGEDRSFQGSKESKGNIRYGGIAHYLTDWINSFVDWDARPLVLGHVQRGGSPTAMDRILGFSLGSHAANLILSETHNQAICFQQGKVMHMPIDEMFENNQEQQKNLSEDFYALCMHATK